MHGRCCRPAASSVLYTTSCKHSQVLLRMGEIIARNIVPPHPGHQQAASSVLYTTSCKHSLVHLRMVEIIARNMLSWLKLLIKLLLLHLVGSLYYCTFVGLHVQHPLFLTEYSRNCILPTDVRKILKCEISWKSVYCLPSCSMLTDRQTDMTKLIVGFSNFANAPKNFHFFHIMLVGSV